MLYKKADFEKAAKWLERAIRVGGDADPVIADHLGDACWRAGRQDDAVGHWRDAVKYATERLESEDALGGLEDGRVLEGAEEKLSRVEAGQPPQVAPLGESVEQPDGE